MAVESSDFVFLTVNGPAVGLGHLRRCLTLAMELAAHGSVSFVVIGDDAGVAIAVRSGFSARGLARAEVEAHLRASPGRMLIVDDYAIGSAELSRYRRLMPIAVIDDLAQRELDCDVILNPGAAADRLHYRTRGRCVKLFGVEYALLHHAFRDTPDRRVGHCVARVLITLGGADPGHATPHVVAAVREALPDADLDVVLGPFFAPASRPTAQRRVSMHEGLENLSTLMAQADLAVTAGGQTTYELAATGLPAVALCIADNQRPNLDALVRQGTLIEAPAAEPSAIAGALQRLAADIDARRRMSIAGRALVDGRGAVRAAAAIAGVAALCGADHA